MTEPKNNEYNPLLFPYPHPLLGDYVVVDRKSFNSLIKSHKELVIKYRRLEERLVNADNKIGELETKCQQLKEKRKKETPKTDILKKHLPEIEQMINEGRLYKDIAIKFSVCKELVAKFCKSKGLITHREKIRAGCKERRERETKVYDVWYGAKRKTDTSQPQFKEKEMSIELYKEEEV